MTRQSRKASFSFDRINNLLVIYLASGYTVNAILIFFKLTTNDFLKRMLINQFMFFFKFSNLYVWKFQYNYERSVICVSLI